MTTLPENAEAALTAAFETALSPKLPQYVIDEVGVSRPLAGQDSDKGEAWTEPPCVVAGCMCAVVVACACGAAPGGRRPGGLHQQPHGSPHRGTSLTVAHTAHIPPEACDPPRTIIPPLPHTRHLTHVSLHTQGLYEAAYGEGSPLGHSFYASGDSMPAGLVGAFRDKTYTASGMTVVGTGIAHAQLVSWASGLAEAIPKSSPLTTPTSTYFGGEARIKVRPLSPSPPSPHLPDGGRAPPPPPACRRRRT